MIKQSNNPSAVADELLWRILMPNIPQKQEITMGNAEKRYFELAKALWWKEGK